MSMREFALPCIDATMAAVGYIAWINPGTDVAPISITRCFWAQSSTTTAAQQRIQLNFQGSTYPSGMLVGQQDPRKLCTSDQISNIFSSPSGGQGFCGVASTSDGAGTKTIVHSDTVSNLNGFLWIPSKADIIIVNSTQALGFGLYLASVPSVTTGQHGGLHFKFY